MNYSHKIAFHTLGCKLNYSETATLVKQAQDSGFVSVPFEDWADYYVLNTCSVTENADKECNYLIRKIKRKAPESKVIIIGCYAQLKPKEISEIPGVDLVLGAHEKFNLSQHLLKLDDASPTYIAGEIKEVRAFHPSYTKGDRTRTFIKIQDGCDYFCSFCTIPLARGRSRSGNVEQTMQTIKSALEEGVQEIVLTGVNTGDFGKGHQEGFIDLVSAIEALPDKIRVRISSIEPNLLNEEIIDLVAQSQKFMPHFHIPLQSGDDEMLKIMHRKYDTDLYRNRIEYIKAKMPHACIGVDVIVGYRDESEAHFQNSLNFVQSLPISYLHVFTYSERDNTRALKSEHFVPIEERRKRNEAFRKISVEKKKNFYKSFIGQEREILFEHAENDGFMYGYTDNYIRCRTPYRAEWVGTLQKISLNNLNNLVVFDL